MCDGNGRPARLHLTAAQVSDFRGTDVLLVDMPDGTKEIIGSCGYDSNKSGTLSQIGTLPPLSPRRRTGNQNYLTTGISIQKSFDRKYVCKAERLAVYYH